MTKRKRNGILITTAIVLLFAAVIGIFAKFNSMETSRKLLVTNYEIGMCSTVDGKVGESNQNIVLKSLYKIEDAEIELKEDATVSVKVFYYDEDKAFIEASTETDLAEAPEGAVYFRVMITPAIVDGEPVTIGALDMLRYTKQVRIVVAK